MDHGNCEIKSGRQKGRRISVSVFFPAILLASIHYPFAAALPAPPIFEAISHYPPFCYLPPESGICPENQTTTMKPTTGKAISWNAGEDNQLGPPQPSEDYDGAGGSVGTGPLLIRYYFDAITAQCYPFGAQECGGNENRFRTQAECMAKCKTY